MTTDIQARLRDAERLQAAGEFGRAEAAFGALLTDDPDSPYLHLRLSEARQSLGQYRDSRAAAVDATGIWSHKRRRHRVSSRSAAAMIAGDR